MQNNIILQDGILDENQLNEDNYTVVEIDNKNYAVKTENVLEIMKIMELDYPNVMPSCILGIMEYEQAPVGLLDLRDIFKSERIVYDLSAKVIVLKTNNSVNAFICDKVSDIRRLEKDKIHPMPYGKNSDFFSGVYINKDENIFIMNFENIVEFVDNNKDKFYVDKNEPHIVDDDQSKIILEERKKLILKTEEAIQESVPLYDRGVSFVINDVKYYINMASVKEFYKVNNSKFIKIPNTPDYIFGLIGIKGDYITVLDIRRLFNNSGASIKEKSTIIILNSSEYKIGILADEICESMNVDFDEIIQNRISNQEENKMMEFVKEGEIYQVLDIETLLKDERLTIC